ncbi:MAG: M1 family metallopeptidase [Pirellulales bacterium]
MKPWIRSRSTLIVMILLVLGITRLNPLLAQDRRGAFTSDPRSVRTREVDQEHIRLEMRVDLEKQTFEGRAIHQLAPFKPLDTLTLDAVDMKIHKATLLPSSSQGEGTPLKFERRSRSLVIKLDKVYQPGESLRVAIDYTVERPQSGAHFVSPDPTEPDQPRMMWTQSEPEFARNWYPCVDTTTDRITSETVVTAAGPMFVLSNGALKSKTDNPDGTRTWHWVQEKSHVPYLMSVVVGDFEAFEQSWDGIPIVSYVPRGKLALAKPTFEHTPAMMAFFSKKIGYRYPWPKYAQICVDEYNWGGMEHTSATTLNLQTLHDEQAHLDVSSDNLVAHELAHQWWGDVVTCKDWGELWLNESFATYFATLWTEEDLGWDQAAWERRAEARSYLNEDKSVRRPIVSYRYNQPDVMFDAHSYPKGGRVLHQLRFELGEELFWRALNRYIQINQHRVVETSDFRTAIEESTGQGLNWFFDQWLYRGGHPEFDVRWDWDEATKSARVVVKQTQKVDDMTPLFRASVEVEFGWGKEHVMRKLTVSKGEETFHFQLDRRPTRVAFDPRDWLLKTVKFEKPIDELLDQLVHDPHVVARVEAIEKLVEHAQEQEVKEALLKTAASDPFWGVRLEAIKALAKNNTNDVRAALLKIARADAKAQVRREAIVALGKFPCDETREVLRAVVREDRSYYAVADALRALVKVDRNDCEADLLSAFDRPSHHDVIYQAACDGLIDLKSQAGAAKLAAKLGDKLSPQQRVSTVSALAKLNPSERKYVEQLREMLNNERSYVRRAAIDSLVANGGPQAADWLREQRGKETRSRMVKTLDEAIEKLNARNKDWDQVRKDLDEMRRLNRQLEERLKKLEAK